MENTQQNIFVIDLEYVADLDAIDAAIPAHIDYLHDGYNDGTFVMSGRKNPRTGGVIIAKGDTLDEIIARVKTDPFIEKSLATFKITQFIPSMSKISF